jgi:uncharacterized protein YodC (DUF2158 family)
LATANWQSSWDQIASLSGVQYAFRGCTLSLNINLSTVGILKMNEIKEGDVVQLKSGGPSMTVSSVGKDNGGTLTAWCQWFEKNKPQGGSFPVSSLRIVDT